MSSMILAIPFVDTVLLLKDINHVVSIPGEDDVSDPRSRAIQSR